MAQHQQNPYILSFFTDQSFLFFNPSSSVLLNPGCISESLGELLKAPSSQASSHTNISRGGAQTSVGLKPPDESGVHKA